MTYRVIFNEKILANGLNKEMALTYRDGFIAGCLYSLPEWILAMDYRKLYDTAFEVVKIESYSNDNFEDHMK